MPERDPQLDERVRDLEREIRELHARIDRGAADREAVTKLPRNPRLAKTCKQTSGGSYPDIATTPNTYWVQFLDSTFTETEGDQTPTDTARQADGAKLAHKRNGDDGDFIEEGTVVAVMFDNGRFWIMQREEGFDRCTATLKGAISGTGEKTVDNVVVSRGVSPLSDPTDTTETLSVWNDDIEFSGDDNGKCRIEYNHTANRWEFYIVKCPV